MVDFKCPDFIKNGQDLGDGRFRFYHERSRSILWHVRILLMRIQDFYMNFQNLHDDRSRF